MYVLYPVVWCLQAEHPLSINASFETKPAAKAEADYLRTSKLWSLVEIEHLHHGDHQSPTPKVECCDCSRKWTDLKHLKRFNIFSSWCYLQQLPWSSSLESHKVDTYTRSCEKNIMPQNRSPFYCKGWIMRWNSKITLTFSSLARKISVYGAINKHLHDRVCHFIEDHRRTRPAC